MKTDTPMLQCNLLLSLTISSHGLTWEELPRFSGMVAVAGSLAAVLSMTDSWLIVIFQLVAMKVVHTLPTQDEFKEHCLDWEVSFLGCRCY